MTLLESLLRWRWYDWTLVPVVCFLVWHREWFR